MNKPDTEIDTRWRCRSRLAWLAASFALLPVVTVANAADGEDIPLFLTLTQQLQHDNNLLRKKENRVSDIVHASQMSFGLDKRYGRQHYVVDATLSKNKYRNNSKYDNDSYSVSNNFTTDIASDFRLVLDGAADRSLPDFADSEQNRAKRNIQTGYNWGGDLRYGLHGQLSVNGGLRMSKVSFAETGTENKESSSSFLGLRYLPNDLMYYGLTYTKTTTYFDNRSFKYISDGAEQNQIGEKVDSDSLRFGFAWQVTGFSLFNGSVGYSKERHKYDKRRDFGGLTGAVGWNYTPTDKTSFSARWSRDTNNSGSGSAIYQVKTELSAFTTNGYVATNRVIDTSTFRVDYELTSKIALDAAYSFAQYSEERKQVVLGTPDSFNSRKSRSNNFTLGGSYRPIRSVALRCTLTFYDRTESQFYEAYDGRAAMCYGSFTLQ